MANETQNIENSLLKIGQYADQDKAKIDRLISSIERLNNSSSFGGGKSGIPNAGGSNVSSSSGGSNNYVLRGMGFTTPQSTNADISNLNKFANAAKQAEQSIKQAYSEGAKSVEVFNRYIEQATGNVVVQAKVTRELKDAQGQAYGTQEFTATSRVNPFTGSNSEFTAAQQAFADQAGGIEKAQQALAKYGLQLNNVTGFYKDLNSSTARFSVTGTDGVSTAMGAMDQFGNSTLHAARNAQTLYQNVTRNIEKVVEWAVATTVLYTAMNSVMTAGKELQDIEETMLDIQIATGASADELDRYYQAALDVANLTGSDVTDTLEAQAKAYRAAGSEADRFGTANILLRDSMILARLAGMDQTKSLDTLVAALRQSGKDLTDGESLLDKWVRTSQIAGVSIEDLAESFAITADVATTVGVTLDELNGIIAVLAEKTTLSGTEVGNAARTMFAGITSDEAVKTLGEFGIAVRTVNGDMRDWMEINQDVVDLMNAGILNDEQINKLANALGGGSRRGPQLITLWRNFGQVSNIAAESFDANGEAASAMQIKLDSLQAAINELHNAFNELVQSLGYEGGFLELMTDIVQLSTELVRSMKEVATAFDDSAASVTAALVAFVAIKRLMSGANLGALNTLGAAPGANQGWGGFPGVGNYLGQNANAGTFQSGVQGMFGAGGAIALGEGLNAALSGEGLETAAPRIASTLAGAFVGNMLLPGVGGLIGAFLADTFVKGVQNQQEAIRAVATGETTGQSADQIRDTLIKYMTGPGFGAFGPYQNKITDDQGLNILSRAIIQSDAYEKAGQARGDGGALASFKQSGFNDTEAGFLSYIMESGTIRDIDEFKNALIDLTASTQEEVAVRQQAANSLPTSVLNQASLLQGPQGSALRSSFSSQENALYREAGRTGNVEDYNKRTNAMQQIATATAAVANAQYGLNVTTDQYVGLGNMLLNTTDEQRDKIILLASGINDARDKLEEMQKVQGRGGTNENMNELILLIQQYETELGHTIELTEKFNAIQFARDNYISPTQVPTDQNGNALTKEQAGYAEALDAAYKAQDEYAQYRGIDPQALRDSVTDPLVLAFADGYTEVRGLTSDFSKDLMDKMKETAEGMKEEISFAFKDMRDVNIDPGALDQKIKYYENVMKQYEPYGYEEKKQNIGILGEGNQVRVLNTTMTALNLAIEDLTEVEKKQLEGQWNLPSGATAYVPINSLFASSGGSSAGGNTGIGENTGIMIDQSANKMDMAGTKMLDAAEAMRIRDINSSRWEGLGAQYAKNNQAEPVKVETNTEVRITPAQQIIQLNGAVLASQMQQYLSEQLSNVSRTTPGGGPKII